MNHDQEPFLKTHQTLLTVLGVIVVVLVVLFAPLVTWSWSRESRNGTPDEAASPSAATPPTTAALTRRATRVPPPPTPSPLYPALNAEFVRGECSLGEGDNTVRTYSCDGDEYRMLHKEPATRYAFYKKDFDDAVIEAQGHFEAGSGSYEYGIVFRADLQGTAYYVFTVTQDGRYNVSRYGNDEYIDLIPYTNSPLVRLGSATNTFKVVMRADQFVFYLNDQYLDTVTDSTFARGVAGLFVYNAVANTEISFNRFTVETFTPAN